MSMKSNSAFQRLQVEYRRLSKDPIPYLTAQPLPSNMLEWRYVVRGPAETPYEGGIYQGKIVFPFEYPYKPPSRSTRSKSFLIHSHFDRYLHLDAQRTLQNEHQSLSDDHVVSS